jgi:hypothetical protein
MALYTTIADLSDSTDPRVARILDMVKGHDEIRKWSPEYAIRGDEMRVRWVVGGCGMDIVFNLNDGTAVYRYTSHTYETVSRMFAIDDQHEWVWIAEVTRRQQEVEHMKRVMGRAFVPPPSVKAKHLSHFVGGSE